MQQSSRKHSGASTILLPLLQAPNSLEVSVVLGIVAIKIDYSWLGWENRDLLIVNPSRDTLLTCILPLWTPKIILE